MPGLRRKPWPDDAHLPHPGARGEDMGEVALPLCRVRSLPIAANGCGIEHGFDRPHTTRRLRFGRPEPIEHLYDKASVDCRDGQIANERVYVSGQGAAPLVAVLGVAPARLVASNIFLRDFAERPALCRRQPPCLALNLLCRDRVRTLPALVPMFVCLLTGFRQRNAGKGPSPMSRRLPSSWNLKTHDFAPLAATRRYKPPPSCRTAGPLPSNLDRRKFARKSHRRLFGD